MAERFVDTHLPYLLARASHAIWRGFEPRLREAGINSLEWRILATLSDSPPLPVGRLAREVLAQQPTVTKTLDRLAARDWVQRQPDPADARRQPVSLTEAGRAQVRPLLAHARRHQRERLKALGLDHPAALQDWLRALVQQFDDADPA